MPEILDWETFLLPFVRADKILAELEVMCGLSVAKGDTALEVPLNAKMLAAAIAVARGAIAAQIDDVRTARLLALMDRSDPPSWPKCLEN